MKPAAKGAAIAVAAVAAGLAAWNFWGTDEGGTGPSGDEAVVQQPSGKVLNADGDAQATAGQTNAETKNDDGSSPAQTDPDTKGDDASSPAQTDQADTQVAAVDPNAKGTSDPDQADQTPADAKDPAQSVDDKDDPQATQPQDDAEGDGQTTDQDGDQQDTQGADQQDTQDGDQQDTQDTDQTTQPDQTDAATDAQQDADAKQPEDPLAPRFDVVRVDPDGQTVVAGKAPPGTEVEIVLDNTVVATVTADSNGGFVAILDIALSDDAQSLQLRIPRDDADPADADAEQQTAALEDKEPEVKTTEGALTGPNLVNGKVPPVGDAPSGEPAAGDAGTLAATEPPQDDVPTTPEITEGPQVPSIDIAEIKPGTISADGAAVNANSAADVNTSAQPQETAGTGFAPVSPVPDAPDEVEAGRYRLSAPVIILPSTEEGASPTLVQPKAEELALLQPAGGDIRGVVLDRISYSEAGDVKLSGRGRSGRAVRIYGNGLLIGTTRVTQDGTWALALASERGKAIKLFRFDEVDGTGGVSSRIETPFEYSSLSPKIVRERRVVIQRGDVLWRIAEQFYGEGVRYSYIYGANTELIRDPDLIYPGQVFSIPELVDAN